MSVRSLEAAGPAQGASPEEVSRSLRPKTRDPQTSVVCQQPGDRRPRQGWVRAHGQNAGAHSHLPRAKPPTVACAVRGAARSPPSGPSFRPAMTPATPAGWRSRIASGWRRLLPARCTGSRWLSRCADAARRPRENRSARCAPFSSDRAAGAPWPERRRGGGEGPRPPTLAKDTVGSHGFLPGLAGHGCRLRPATRAEDSPQRAHDQPTLRLRGSSIRHAWP